MMGDPRAYLYSGLRTLPVELRRVISAISDEDLSLEPGGPSLRQSLCHMLASAGRIDLPFLQRIVGLSTSGFADGETALCERSADWLQGLPEEDWQRIGTHAILGAHPLEWWADRMLVHLEEQLSYIRGD